MALAKDTPRASSPHGGGNFQIVNAAVMYAGAKAAICTPTHGTAASRGRMKPWSGAAGEFNAGWYRQSKQAGDTSANPIVNGALMSDDCIVEALTVTGLAGTNADHLAYVYASDDGTFTLTRPAAPNRTPVGVVWRYRTAAICDVFMFGFQTSLLLSALGGMVETICVGTIGVGIAGSADLLKGYKLSGHGKIIDTYAICVHSPTDADVDVDANLEIGGTNVTGGVIELVTADTVGLLKQGTAITAENEFHDGDALDVDGVVNTAGTAADPGVYNLYITVERLLGL
jgi:hypothetical protein